MAWLWDNAVTIGTLVMAAAAIAALIYAHLQISENRRAERRGNANELWRYLRLAFENPKLSDPTLHLADFNYEALTIDGSPEMFQKYELFVDTILNASEEILERRCAFSSGCIAAICCRRTFSIPATLRNTHPSSGFSCTTP
jgi:hypothetical protein